MSQSLSREELVADLQRVADEIGKPPGVKEYYEHGEYNAATYERRFGSWNEAKMAAGLDIRARGRAPTPREELLTDLKRVTEKIGKSPTETEYNEYGEYTPSTYAQRFESWNAAKEAVGLDINQSNIPRGVN